MSTYIDGDLHCYRVRLEPITDEDSAAELIERWEDAVREDTADTSKLISPTSAKGLPDTLREIVEADPNAVFLVTT